MYKSRVYHNTQVYQNICIPDILAFKIKVDKITPEYQTIPVYQTSPVYQNIIVYQTIPLYQTIPVY